MAILLSNVSNALQKVIMPYIQDNFNKNTLLLDKLKRNDGVTAMNDNFYAPVRTSRHGTFIYFIFAKANSLKFPFYTPEVTNGIGISL